MSVRSAFVACSLLAVLTLGLTENRGDDQLGGKRVFVPVEDLDAVFDKHGQGVLLAPRELQELLDAARKNTTTTAPKSAVLSKADYAGTITGEHLVLKGTLDFQQFATKWEAIPLPFEGLSIEAATVDDKPARLGNSAQTPNWPGDLGQGLFLFSREAGAHTLKVDLSARLVNVGSDQVAAIKLPLIGVASLKLPVPAGKFLHVNEVPLERPAATDQPAEYTVALGGKREVSLRITDQQAEQTTKSLVFASTGIGVHVAPEEVTWQAVSTVQVFGQPLDTLEFVIPKSLQIISVESTGLERWEIAAGPSDDLTLLKLTYRQPFRDSRSVTFQGVRTTVLGQSWAVPTLALQQAASQTVSVLVQHPGSLRLQVVDVQNARRIGADELKADMPDMAKAVAASQQLHFAAWKPDFQIQLVAQSKAREIQSSIVTKLDLSARDVSLLTSLIVQARFAPVFEITLTIPADWSPTEVLVGGKPLAWQVSPAEVGINRVRLPLASPLPPGGSLEIRLSARRVTSEDWPPADNAAEGMPAASLPLPEIRLEDSAVTEGTYQIAGDDDLEFVIADLSGLDPAPISETEQKSARPPRLAYEYQDTSFSGTLNVTRKATRVAAMVLGYHRLEQRTVVSHLEARLAVRGSGVRTLPLFLSEAAGEALRFRLASGNAQIVEQSAAPPQNGRRLWTLQLDQRTSGLIHLVVDLEVPRPAQGQITLPALRIGNADRHDVYLAMEGHPDQQLTIEARDAAGQPLTPFDPPDLPAPVGYFPQQRIVAAYHTVDADAALKVTDSRFERLGVPTAICDFCGLKTVLGEAGEVQHQAHFELRVVGVQSLNVRLPENATLWSAELDHTPIEVRKQAAGLFAIPVPEANGAAVTRELKLVYREAGQPLALNGRIVHQPPQLTALSGSGASQGVEILSRTWNVVTPHNTLLIDSHGTFKPTDPLVPDSLLWRIQQQFQTNDPSRGLGGVMGRLLAAAIAFVVLYGIHRALLAWKTIDPRLFAAIVCLGIFGSACALCVVSMMSSWGPIATSKSGMDTYTQADPAPAMATPRPDFDRDEDARQAAGEAKEAAGEAMPAEPKPMEEPTAQTESMPQKRMEGADQPKAGAAAPPAGQPGFGGPPIPPAAEPAAPPADEVAAGDKQVADSALPRQAEATGLKSLQFDVAQPQLAVTRTFTYTGNGPVQGEPNLVVDYQDRASLDVLRGVVAMAVVLLCWWLRRTSLAVRGGLTALGLTLPLALAPLVPGWWLPLLDGAFLGTLAGVGLWLLLRIFAEIDNALVPPRKGIFSAKLPMLLLVVLAGGSVMAQAPPPPPAEKAPVIVPYDSATDLSKADRVLLPFEKFIDLWNQGHPENPKVAPAPIEGAVAEALYAVTWQPAAGATPAQIEVTGRFALHNLRDGQVTLPLPMAYVPLTSAKLDGQSAPIVEHATETGKVPAIVVTKPGPHVVDVTFRLAAEQAGQTGKFTLPLKPVPAGTIRLTLPAKDLSLRVTGGSGSFRQVVQNDVAVAVIPVAAGGDVTVSWAPTQVREKVDGIVQVDSTTAVNVMDAGVSINAGYRYVIRQGSISEAAFTLPAGLQIKRISGPDVGGWTPPADAEPRTVAVSFRRAITDSTHVVFELFAPLELADGMGTFAVPQFTPTQITRETGVVAVYADKHLAVSPGQVTGLSQIDVGQFAAVVDVPRPASTPLFVYRHVTRPFQLPLNVSRQKPVSKGIAEHAILITPRKVKLKSRFDLTLTGAPRSEIALQLPEGYLLFDVTSADLADWTITQADALAPFMLRLELTAPRTGRVEFLLDGAIPREPTAEGGAVQPPIPADVQDLRSSAAVWVDSLYTGTLTTFEGWKSVDPSELSERLKRAKPQAADFAFTSNSTTPGFIELGLPRATAGLSADTLAAVLVHETRVEYVLALQWRIDRAAETQFTFTTPDWLGSALDVDRGQGPTRIRQVLSQKLPDGRVRWTLFTEEPQRERYFITARAVVAPPKLAAPPATAPLPAPEIIVEHKPAPDAEYQPLATQRSYLMRVNQSPWQIDTADPNLVDSIPADELPIRVRQTWLNQAGEVQRLKTVTQAGGWTVRPVQSLQSLAASVNLMEIKLVLASDATYRAKLALKVNNRARQFLGLTMPEGSQILSLFVQNAPARPLNVKVGSAAAVLIPMPKTAAGDLSAEVQLVYAGRLAQLLPEGLRLRSVPITMPAPHVLSQTESPQFGAPVSRTEFTVWVPKDLEGIRWDDPALTNVTESTQGYERFLSDVADQMEIAQNYANFNSSGRYRVKNNMKQLGLSLENFNEAQKRDVEAKLSQLNAAQQAVQEQDAREKQSGQQEGQQAAAQDFSDTLKGDNAVTTEEGRKSVDDFTLQLDQPQDEKKSEQAQQAGNELSNRRGKLREQAKGQAEGLNNPYKAGGVQQRPYSSRYGTVNGLDQDGLKGIFDGRGFGGFGNRQGQPYGRPKITVDDLPPDATDEQLRDHLDVLIIKGNEVDVDRAMALLQQQQEGVLAGQLGGQAGFTPSVQDGLSLPIDVPESGTPLTFSKVGGDPKLTLGIRPRRSLELAFGLGWTALWVAVGIGALLAFRGPVVTAALTRHLPLALTGLGLLWFLALPVPALGFALFVVSGFVVAWQSARRATQQGS